MADSSPSQDVEQVLTSIRRIVGEGAPARRQRLILTPALRVPPASPESRGHGNAAAPENGAPVGADRPAQNGRPAGAVPKTALPAGAEGDALEQRIAELEAVIARADASWEAEVTPRVAAALGKLSAEVAPAAGRAATVQPAPEGKGAPNGHAHRGTEGPDEISEDELRSLITRIVREELQGDLGARITRNLRKLIRTEIRRALAVKNGETD